MKENESLLEGPNRVYKPGNHNPAIIQYRSRLASLSEIDVEQVKIANYADTVKQLDAYYGQVKRQLLRYQSCTSGLFPQMSSETEVAAVRDSIYCAVAIWSLYQAYKRIDDDRGKAYELGQSTVKCMRGILFCWMRQAEEKLEKYKTNQCPEHALHSKFHLETGQPLENDEEYGHLQLDVVSLYLLFLVQMIMSGLQIIYTMDEVNFVQNLVYYVERAYRTPDFGMWERGSKYNDNTPEIHASSIGMAKSALEAINGCNLFGDKGASWSVVYVDIDAHSRNRSIFETLLPRESSSKNTDSSLLPTISFPCFATHDELLYNRTKEKIVRKLQGTYGFKRFLRDGYGTAVEDTTRRVYEQGETKEFENIECEWPLFFIYMILDGIFKGNDEQIKKYRHLLHPRLKVDKYGNAVIPKYFYVPTLCIEAERRDPCSQKRIPSDEGDADNLYLHGQALYIMSELLVDGLLHINELDPIRRYLPSYNRPRKTGRYSAFQGKAAGTANDLVVQVVLIAESMRLQAMMATYGIHTQTPHEVEPVQIWSPSQLVKIYEYLGISKKLGLKGRPPRPIGALGTSKLYRICGQTVICYPLIFEVSDFYLSHDMALLIDDIKNELHFVGKYWRMSGRPTVCILIREEHMRDVHFKEMLDLLAMLKKGDCDGLKIRTGRLQNLISSSCIEHLDFLHLLSADDLPTVEAFQQLEHASIGYQSLTDIPKAIIYNEPTYDFKEFQHRSSRDILEALSRTDTLHGQSQLLGILYFREGPQFWTENGTVKERLEKLTRQAGALRHWSVVRYCSSVLRKLVDSISPNITSILVCGKQITVGVFGHEEVVIDKPLTPREVEAIIYSKCQEHDIYQAVLQQEIILYVGRLISTTSHLFQGILKIRIGWVLQAMILHMKFLSPNPPALESLSPSELRKVLYRVLTLSENGSNTKLTIHERRQIEGALCRVPKNFYDRVWDIMSRTPEGIIVEGHHLPQQPTLTEMTVYDLKFATEVEMFLSRVALPEYRQILVELIMVVYLILERNPELSFNTTIDMNKLVEESFLMYQKDNGIDREGDMTLFFDSPTTITASYLARAVMNHLLKCAPDQGYSRDLCIIS
ncbi:probable phosphorylase b kinase regulatory subunit beta isoform X3 [Parasteatoda tepidariorum]|uniref:probable phosphorylase b kinase regulatory subunit beta isoform X3 n=1 Tax=Parasteatoda tepidariorum TaxID=114398 RepID=UPI001C722B71|nr:probable phosphorylase b kinase regulatory subunit beta isoform X3 [Parasteatoda tepidariorum]